MKHVERLGLIIEIIDMEFLDFSERPQYFSLIPENECENRLMEDYARDSRLDIGIFESNWMNNEFTVQDVVYHSRILLHLSRYYKDRMYVEGVDAEKGIVFNISEEYPILTLIRDWESSDNFCRVRNMLFKLNEDALDVKVCGKLEGEFWIHRFQFGWEMSEEEIREEIAKQALSKLEYKGKDGDYFTGCRRLCRDMRKKNLKVYERMSVLLAKSAFLKSYLKLTEEILKLKKDMEELRKFSERMRELTELKLKMQKQNG